MSLPAQRPRHITKREAEGIAARRSLEEQGVSLEEYAQGMSAFAFLALSNTLPAERLEEVLTALPHLRQ